MHLNSQSEGVSQAVLLVVKLNEEGNFWVNTCLDGNFNSDVC